MKTTRIFLPLLLLLCRYAAISQDNITSESVHTPAKLIAVVNRASWCQVCKANGERAGTLLMSYIDKGVRIYMKDLTDSASITASKKTLRAAHLFVAVYTRPRRGVGGMIQHCGLLKGKSQTTLATGVVTFISPNSYKVVKQLSIAIPTGEMKAQIDSMLK